MTKLHSGFMAAVGLAVVMGAAHTGAQSATPYKLGMFQQGGRTFVGLVIQNDTQVIDLSRVAAGTPGASEIMAVNMPTSVKQLITQWDEKKAAALAALAAKPGTTIPVAQLKTLPPIPDPTVLLNAAVNYRSTRAEMTDQRHRGRRSAAVDPKVAQRHSGHVDAQSRRSAAQSVFLPEGQQRRSPATAIRSSCRRTGRRSTGNAS